MKREVGLFGGISVLAGIMVGSGEEIGDSEESELRPRADPSLGDRTSPMMRSPIRTPLKSPAKSPAPDMPHLSPGPVSYLAKTSPTARVVV